MLQHFQKALLSETGFPKPRSADHPPRTARDKRRPYRLFIGATLASSAVAARVSSVRLRFLRLASRSDQIFMKPDTLPNRIIVRCRSHIGAHRAVCEPALHQSKQRTRDELYGGLRRNAPIAPPRSVTCHRGYCALPPIRCAVHLQWLSISESLRGCRTKFTKLFYHGQ